MVPLKRRSVRGAWVTGSTIIEFVALPYYSTDRFRIRSRFARNIDNRVTRCFFFLLYLREQNDFAYKYTGAHTSKDRNDKPNVPHFLEQAQGQHSATTQSATGMATTTFRYFGSGMSRPFHMLSNFNECRIAGRVFVEHANDRSQHQQDLEEDTEQAPGEQALVEREFIFPCAEHYWWAHFTKKLSDVSRLAVGGDLSTVHGGFCLLLGRERGAQKAAHWAKKGNVGIVSKMVAANNKATGGIRCRATELGMEMGQHPLEEYGAQGDIGTLDAIWRKIQTDKFSQNSEHRAVLLSTGSEVLVEMVRMRPDGHMWGGQVRGGVKRSKGLVEGGEVVGRNFMGKCLMTVRASL